MIGIPKLLVKQPSGKGIETPSLEADAIGTDSEPFGEASSPVPSAVCFAGSEYPRMKFSTERNEFKQLVR
jgi:hypothetical protein